MTTFVLDTDMMSLLQRGDRDVAAHFDRHQPYDVATTIISVEEQLSGWYTLLRRARTPMDLARIYGHTSETVRFLGTLPILTFTVGAAGIYERLRSRHPRIGRMDHRQHGLDQPRDACRRFQVAAPRRGRAVLRRDCKASLIPSSRCSLQSAGREVLLFGSRFSPVHGAGMLIPAPSRKKVPHRVAGHPFQRQRYWLPKAEERVAAPA